MAVLNVRLDNFFAFRNFEMNLTYPKKIVNSTIEAEHLKARPNFRYKKVNIIMGANASGKSTLGLTFRAIFNFISKKNPSYILDAIADREREASFTIDLVHKNDILYHIDCAILPKPGRDYNIEDIKLKVRKETILPKDSYESCLQRLEAASDSPHGNYLEELDKVEWRGWMFEYPKDIGRIIQFDPEDKKFLPILEKILKALDPSILKVERSKDVDDAYVIRLRGESVILKNEELFTTNRLSSGTKAGVEVARVVSALLQGRNSFYYCDEKFSYIHSDVEQAILSVMIGSIRPNEQLFFTTHNADVLDMDLPKHAFTFLRRDLNDAEHPITCVSASSLLKRNSDSVKNAVENDLFSTAPAVELIYDIAEL